MEITLDIALRWYTQNRLKINPSKTELLLIKSNKKRCDTNLRVTFGECEITPSEDAKILGVYIDSSLTWEKHVSLVARRCYHILVGLSKLRRKLPYETKKLLIEALVFPHIMYCCTVWGGCCTTQKRRIQRAINFAARIVTGLSRRDHVSPSLEALGWPRFEEMLRSRDLAMVQRLLSPTAPPALADIVERRSDVSLRRTRGTCDDQLQLPRIKTERARRSFPFRAVTSWNRRHHDI